MRRGFFMIQCGLVVAMGICLLSVKLPATAQGSSFDIALFTPPSGWQPEQSWDFVAFTYTGELEQSFPCSAELRNLNGWTLVIGGKSSLPYDFGGTLRFESNPQVDKTCTLEDLESASQMARDKHDQGPDTWSASVSKKPATFGDKKIPTPVGSLTLKLTAIGPEPAVHGTLTVTLKPSPRSLPAFCRCGGYGHVYCVALGWAPRRAILFFLLKRCS